MGIDWSTLLVPKVSILELVLRGTIVYFILFGMLRVLARRHVGALSIMDLLVIVLIADAAQNAMASEYRSLPEGIVLCATIIGWSYALDFAAFRYKGLRAWLEPSPLPLIRDGKILRKNMRQELVSLEELQSHLREHGITDIGEIQMACLEPDGQLSVIKKQRGSEDDDGPTHKAQPT
ncbi:MAG: DUF421 domain-containing protein [Pirellulales bacterium]